ncbi:3-ketoacyl-reductase [Halteromyces radiatus]|uniref:3-ketoacyl-reductase n=1 Tax=Halteromyces radiatus TaxID=101107 RepID=UPI00221E93C1|nr:3-ketoacyl-reductase [Halteromyces radiatus]KAI8086489.1 3-ketoacyl-reductase [Halteromyces radiatus]
MNNTAIITGATRGIGLAIAHAFAKQNKQLVLIGRDETRVAAVQELFQETYGDGHVGIALDVSNKEAIDQTLKDLIKGKTIDLLVNAAGISRDGLLLQTKEKDVQDIINTNLLGTMYVTQHIAKAMIRKRQGGCIINLSSVIGLSGNPGQCIYSASKAGIIGFTKSLAKELGPLQIRVNAIAPGFIETDMTAGILGQPDKRASVLASIPLRRFGQVDDIAEAALFIERSKYMHGQVLQIDGGLIV